MSSPIKTATNGRQFVDAIDYLGPEGVTVDGLFRVHTANERRFNAAHPSLMWPDEEHDLFWPTALFIMAHQSGYGNPN